MDPIGGNSYTPAMAQPTREQILDAARGLIPVLRERAPEAERIRRIPDETIADLRRAGLWDILKPARYGGVETDYRLMIDVTVELGRGCAATSWVYINLVAHNWMLPYWPDRAAEDIWGEDPDALIGSTLVFPAGRLAPADGGYLLTGRWPYASGVDSSDWMMLGAIGQGKEDDAPGPRIVLVRAADIEIIDTWQVSGLVGTGSKDVACEDLFLPAHMVLDMAPSREGYPPETEGMSDAYLLPLAAADPAFGRGPDDRRRPGRLGRLRRPSQGAGLDLQPLARRRACDRSSSSSRRPRSSSRSRACWCARTAWRRRRSIAAGERNSP